MNIHTLLSACRCAGICVVLLLSAQLAVGQTAKTVTLNFDEKDFEYVYDDDGCLLISSEKVRFKYNEDFSAPSLPMIHFNLLVAATESFNSITVSGSERVVKTNIKILPNPYVISTDMQSVSYIHRNILYEDSIYPSSNAEYICAGVMDGYRLLAFMVCPYKYNAVNGELIFIDNLSVTINLISQQDSILVNASKTRGGIMSDIVREITVNGNDMNNLYDSTGDNIRKSIAQNLSNAPVDYLIITNESLAPSFVPLAKWKKQKGVRTEIITVEQIYAQYANSQGRDQVKIKHCIEDYKTYRGTQFVLLGGDADVVPVQYCYSCVKQDSATWIEDAEIPTDIFYACFGGNYEWNGDGNNVIGTIKDNVNLLPDIFLTRIPVRTSADVETFVNRTISYEKSPPIETWKNRALFGGAKLHNVYTVGGRFMSDAEYEGDILYSNYFKWLWDGVRTRYYDTWSDVTNQAQDISSSGLQTCLSDGFSFLDMNCHGTSDGWYLNYYGWYSGIEASDLVSTQPSLITTTACHTNWFDQDNSTSNCLSEAFFRNPNSGVIAYIGSSRYGWGYGFMSSPPSCLGSSAEFNADFYSFLFADDSSTKHFGAVVSKTKALSFYCNNVYNTMRWLMFAINPMGDCEMPIYTTTPKVFEGVELSFFNNSLTVNAGMEECRICVMDLENENSYYYVRNDTQYGYFPSLPNHFSICVTKQGYVPYLEEIYRPTYSENTYYIQNETLKDLRDYDASNIAIGSDVTTLKANGPVTIEAGKTIIKASDGVLIKNNFEVKEGAEFVIE